MVKIDFINGRVRVFIPGDSGFQRNLDAVKSVGGGRYKADERIGRHHHFPMMRLPRLLDTFPQAWLGKNLADFMERAKRAAAIKTLKDAEQPVGIMVELRPLQRVAHAFLTLFGRCILANDIGTGKTLNGIAYAHARAGRYPGRHGTLVVTKDAGKYAYQAEILRAVPGARVVVIEGREGWFPKEGTVDWLVISYDLFESRLKQIHAFNFETAIFSEAHKLRGAKAPRARKDGTLSPQGTKRGSAGLEIGSTVPQILMETASLTPHRNADLFPLLQILGYVTVDDYYPWHIHFAGSTKVRPDGTVENLPATKIKINRRGTLRWEFSGSSFCDELHESIAPFTFAKTKAEAIPERRSEPTFEPIPVNLSNADEYRDAEIHFLKWVEGEKGAEAVARAKKALAITKRNALLQLAAKGVVHAVVEELDSYAAAREKVVVFSTFKAPLHDVAAKYPEMCVMVTGDESGAQKEASIQAFQTDPTILFCLCTIGAGGESATLTAAHHVIFMSLPDGPEDFRQSWGRVDRIGQKFDVLVKIILARRSVVIDLVEMVYGKAINVDKVITGADRSPNSEALRAIMERLSGTARLQ